MRVTLARDYVTDAGKTIKADTTADLPSGEARNLIHTGAARLPAPAPKPAPKPSGKGANEQKEG